MVSLIPVWFTLLYATDLYPLYMMIALGLTYSVTGMITLTSSPPSPPPQKTPYQLDQLVSHLLFYFILFYTFSYESIHTWKAFSEIL